MADLTYHPVHGDLQGILSDDQPVRLLYVGDLPAIEDVSRPPDGTRELLPDSSSLPTGIYRFREERGWSVMVAWSDRPPVGPMSAMWDADDDDPMINAYGWFRHWWDAASEVPVPNFAANALVLLSSSNEEGLVRRVRYSGGAWQYSVRVGSRTLQVAERELVAPPLVDDPYEWIQSPPADARRLAATLTRAKLSQRLNDTLYSFKATRTIFRAYQFKPVIRLLEAERPRLLIADEVGLGKTIEAGLVWTELDARRQADRVLVVCPSALVPKWQHEMEDRFGYELTEATGPVLADFLERLENDRLPSRLRMVCSLERLRTWQGLQRTVELGPRFDLVIVDEAHALRNRGTRSFELAQHLTLWADAMVFLSATPLNLGNDDLFNLLEVLAPGEFASREDLEERLQPNRILNRLSAGLFDASVSSDDRLDLLSGLAGLSFGRPLMARNEFRELEEILSRDELAPVDVARCKRLLASMHALSTVVTRTRKVEVMEDRVVRSPELIEVRWTKEERTLYEAISFWQRHQARISNVPAGFALQMPLRLASSCLPAARDRVLGAGSGIAGEVLWEEDEYDDLDDFEDVDLFGDSPTAQVIAAARALGNADSKFDRFLEALLPIVGQGRRVLVFSFSRPVVAYLQRRLAEHVRVEVLHGGIPKADRGPLMRRFREHHFDVLVASRVASEGLDFEFCSAVVNYDLPWNPMEVEQRIGRIDRFGQPEQKVFVFNFQTPGTIETDILLRVMDRIGVFTDSIGELDPILRPLLPELKSTMFDFHLTEAERDRRLAEIEAAIVNGRHDLAEMESASGFLASVDSAEIAGLERNLVSTGRYIGVHELVMLLEDWVSLAAGASIRRSADGRTVEVRGTAELERHVFEVRGVGERSLEEIERLARRLRDEQPIVLSVDQQDARVRGLDLLSTTHPLVRASLRVRPDVEARFGAVKVRVDGNELSPPAGRYLSLVAVSNWSGVRPSTELWSTTVPLSGGVVPDADRVSDALLSALAAGELEAWTATVNASVESALAMAERDMMRRRDSEETRRRTDNAATVELRRMSVQQSHERKLRQVRAAIETLRMSGNERMVSLQESQISASERRLAEAFRKLEESERCSLTLEHLAVCLVEVVHG
jgi:superfamily II DNA or RNA helicase